MPSPGADSLRIIKISLEIGKYFFGNVIRETAKRL